MTRLRRILLATLLALSFSAGAAAQTDAHSYYGGTYCDYTTRTLFRYHYHGVYDVGGREAYHSQHMHAVGYCV